MIRYFRTDFRRIRKSWRFYGAVAGIVLVFFYSLEKRGLRNSVLESYIASVNGSGIHIAAVFCAGAFATSLCEDFEHRYVYYEVIRGDSKKYLFSRVLAIYLSAVLVMLAGTMIFCCISSLFVPWARVSDSVYNLALNGSYRGCILSGHYLTYCLLFSLQLGMYMGILAVAASFLSLFTTNMGLILSFPILLDQFFIELPSNNVLSFAAFCPIPARFEADWQGFLCLLFLSVASVGLLLLGMRIQMKRKW